MAANPRRILLSLDVRPAGKRCACKHDKRHEILRGELRLGVKEPGPASGEKLYCADCGLAMIAAAYAALQALEGSLKAGPRQGTPENAGP